MKIRAQFAMVFNLDKCIGCHTCSVTCKNVWTNRKGVEYAWFNNVESKPGIGYPKQWENQDKCRGWRYCVSGCPYKKVFYNWESGKAEKCIGCYP
ncbi:MAG TPA: 4Fe-4S dicluster domain-containing protein, partial [Rhodocyclaceae bacterium]|nr:4Fe-4S dicluster domain-containing protein [Rhodocyclaceae bacterium]